MSEPFEAILNQLVGEPHEMLIQAHIASHNPPISQSALFQNIARRNAEAAIASGWTTHKR